MMHVLKKTRKFFAHTMLCAALCLALCACGGNTVMLRSVSQEQTGETEETRAVSCAALSLPSGLRAPQTDGAVNTIFADGVLAGAFASVDSCRTGDFTAGPSVTVRVQAALDGGAPADAKLALWQDTPDGARYVETAVFSCDGTAQAHTFAGLASGTGYRLVFSSPESGGARMTGAFTVDGVTAELPDELPGDAVAVDTPWEDVPVGDDTEGSEDD